MVPEHLHFQNKKLNFSPDGPDGRTQTKNAAF